MKCIVIIKFTQTLDPHPCLIGINLDRGLKEKLYPEGLLKLKLYSKFYGRQYILLLGEKFSD